MRVIKELAAVAAGLMMVSACNQAPADKPEAEEATETETEAAADTETAAEGAAKDAATKEEYPDVNDLGEDKGGSQDLPELEAAEEPTPPDDGGSQDDPSAAGEP